MEASDTITLERKTSSNAAWGGASTIEVTIPMQLGSVRLIREIGRGGMGVVWLGRDEMLGRDVAVKFLLNAITSKEDPDFARFLEGARAAAAVRHPGLTAVYQADLINGLPYLVMEYINGPTLADVLRRNGPLSVPQALAVMSKCCEAIAELHDRGIVHRDIKPANIMLNAAGEVFVTDFGLACGLVPVGAAITVEGLAGTPAYMAPEMFDGVVSPRSDVYALGVMMFELLTARVPFSGDVEEIVRGHRNDAIPQQPLLDRGVDPAIVDVIERATNKNPMFRLKTARHFVEAARHQAKGGGVVPTDSTTLVSLIARCEGLLEDAPINTPSPSSSSYFAELSTFAKQRNRSAPLAQTQTVRPLLPFVGGAIATFVTCIDCGYELRGKGAEGRCPECGTPIAASLNRDRLLFSEPAWLSSLISGCCWLRGWLWSLVIFFTSPLWLILAFDLLHIGSSQNTTAFEAFLDVASWIRFGNSTFGMMLFAIAAWLLTKNHHSFARSSYRQVNRLIVRTVVVFTFLPRMLSEWTNAVTRSANPLDLLEVLGTYLPLLAYVALIWYLVQLAKRIPDDSLARRGMLLAAIALPTVAIMVVAKRYAETRMMHFQFEYYFLILSFGGLGIMITYLIVLDQFVRSLRRTLIRVRNAIQSPGQKIDSHK